MKTLRLLVVLLLLSAIAHAQRSVLPIEHGRATRLAALNTDRTVLLTVDGSDVMLHTTMDVWNMRDGVLLRRFTFPLSSCKAWASSDLSLVYLQSGDLVLYSIDASSGTIIDSLPGVLAFNVRESMKTTAVIRNDGLVELRDMLSLALLHSYGRHSLETPDYWGHTIEIKCLEDGIGVKAGRGEQIFRFYTHHVSTSYGTAYYRTVHGKYGFTIGGLLPSQRTEGDYDSRLYVHFFDLRTNRHVRSVLHTEYLHDRPYALYSPVHPSDSIVLWHDRITPYRTILRVVNVLTGQVRDTLIYMGIDLLSPVVDGAIKEGNDVVLFSIDNTRDNSRGVITVDPRTLRVHIDTTKALHSGGVVYYELGIPRRIIQRNAKGLKIMTWDGALVAGFHDTARVTVSDNGRWLYVCNVIALDNRSRFVRYDLATKPLKAVDTFFVDMTSTVLTVHDEFRRIARDTIAVWSAIDGHRLHTIPLHGMAESHRLLLRHEDVTITRKGAVWCVFDLGSVYVRPQGGDIFFRVDTISTRPPRPKLIVCERSDVAVLHYGTRQYWIGPHARVLDLQTGRDLGFIGLNGLSQINEHLSAADLMVDTIRGLFIAVMYNHLRRYDVASLRYVDSILMPPPNPKYHKWSISGSVVVGHSYNTYYSYPTAPTPTRTGSTYVFDLERAEFAFTYDSPIMWLYEGKAGIVEHFEATAPHRYTVNSMISRESVNILDRPASFMGTFNDHHSIYFYCGDSLVLYRYFFDDAPAWTFSPSDTANHPPQVETGSPVDSKSAVVNSIATSGPVHIRSIDLTSQEICTISIISIDGTTTATWEARSFNGELDTTIDISHLAPGLYALQVNQAGRVLLRNAVLMLPH